MQEGIEIEYITPKRRALQRQSARGVVYLTDFLGKLSLACSLNDTFTSPLSSTEYCLLYDVYYRRINRSRNFTQARLSCARLL